MHADDDEPAPEPIDPDKRARLEKEELCFIEKPFILTFFKEKLPELELTDRAPVWAVVTVDAFFSSVVFKIAGWRTALDVIELVRHDPRLQSAVVGAYRMKAAAFEIIDLVLTWAESTKEESNERENDS